MHSIRTITLFFLPLLVCCKSDPVQINDQTKSEPRQIHKNPGNIPDDLTSLNSPLQFDSAIKNQKLKKHFFGAFFQQRANFFIIHEPNRTLYQKKVKAITLYYLDDELFKTKYTIEEDISSKLINSFGKFEFHPHDSLGRALGRNKQLIQRKNGKTILNESLTNYELRWSLADMEIIAKVNKIDGLFEYVERRKDFEQAYKSVKLSDY